MIFSFFLTVVVVVVVVVVALCALAYIVHFSVPAYLSIHFRSSIHIRFKVRETVLLLNELAFRMRLTVTSTMQKKGEIKEKNEKSMRRANICGSLLFACWFSFIWNALLVANGDDDDDDKFYGPITILCHAAVRCFHSVVAVHGMIWSDRFKCTLKSPTISTTMLYLVCQLYNRI